VIALNRRALFVLVALSACPESPASGPKEADSGSANVKSLGPPIGELKLTRGSVSVTRQGVKNAALPGDLFALDIVETGAQSEATLRLGAGREVVLGALGRYEVRSTESGLVLEIEMGELKTRSTGGANANANTDFDFSIETPGTVTRLNSASSLNVGLRDGAVDLEVVQGRIQYLSKGGEVVTLEAGTRRRLSPGATEATPTDKSVTPLTLKAFSNSGFNQLKPNGKANFSTIDAKSPPALSQGDTLRSNGELTLRSDSDPSAFRLNRGSEVVVGVSEGGNGRTAHGLRLNRGELSIQAIAGSSTVVQLGDDVSIDIVKGGQVTVLKTRTGFEINSLTGTFSVSRAGQPPVTVVGGSSAVIQGEKIDTRAPKREVLQLPTRNGLRLYHAGLQKLSLTWGAEDTGAEVSNYRIQVAAEPTFAKVFLDGTVGQRFVNVAVPRRGPLFWRVYDAANDAEIGRGNVLVAPEAVGADLGRLKNDVLAGNEKTTIYFQDKPPLVNFQFLEEAGAVKYRLQVFREGELNKPVAERLVSGLTTSLPEGTLVEGKYLWSATPLNTSGQEIQGGRLNKLDIVYDNAVSNLIIRSPRNGDAGGKKVKVAGIAPAGARVYVNGRPIELDDTARFETVAEPIAGKVVFRMLNGASEVYTVRTVRGGTGTSP
jgi:hypothetical protein